MELPADIINGTVFFFFKGIRSTKVYKVYEYVKKVQDRGKL